MPRELQEGLINPAGGSGWERRKGGRDLLAWAFRVARLRLGKNLGRVHSRHQEQHVLRHLGRKEPDVFKLFLCLQFSLWLSLVLSQGKERHNLFLGWAGCPPGWPECSSLAFEDSLRLSVLWPESKAVACKWLFASLPAVSPVPLTGRPTYQPGHG